MAVIVFITAQPAKAKKLYKPEFRPSIPSPTLRSGPVTRLAQTDWKPNFLLIFLNLATFIVSDTKQQKLTKCSVATLAGLVTIEQAAYGF